MDTETEFRTLQPFIGGAWVDAEAGAAFEVLNPLDDSLYAIAAKGAGGDMRKAVAAARAAFPGCRKTLPAERVTKKMDKAFHFARNIGAGMCHINGPTIHDEAHVPFGGNAADRCRP